MERLFGTAQQTKVLVMLVLLESSYRSELSRLTGVSPTAVSSLLDRLEEDGVVVSVTQGRNRRVSINPRYKARAELVALLKTLGMRSPEILEVASRARRRPRKKGKGLWTADAE